ncbi:hypothetical protein J6V86_02895 [bacterium]|nr:hypothetical protein [bacterium]
MGIILNAKLKLIREPTASSLNFKSFDNLDNVLMYVKSIRDKKNSELSALEIINPQVSKTV